MISIGTVTNQIKSIMARKISCKDLTVDFVSQNGIVFHSKDTVSYEYLRSFV